MIESQDGEQWLNDLVQNYAQELLRYTWLYFGNREWAEDACQEVFLRVHRKWKLYRGDAAPHTWLMKIAVNTCHNISKSKAYRHHKAETSLEGCFLNDDVDMQVILDHKAVWGHVLQLSEKYKTVILLKYYIGYSSNEIAAMLRVPSATVRTREARALKQLRIQLEGVVDNVRTEAY